MYNHLRIILIFMILTINTFQSSPTSNNDHKSPSRRLLQNSDVDRLFDTLIKPTLNAASGQLSTVLEGAIQELINVVPSLPSYAQSLLNAAKRALEQVLQSVRGQTNTQTGQELSDKVKQETYNQMSPTQSPTQKPTTKTPSAAPTKKPTAAPVTPHPTKKPITAPTKKPTQSPITKAPTSPAILNECNLEGGKWGKLYNKAPNGGICKVVDHNNDKRIEDCGRPNHKQDRIYLMVGGKSCVAVNGGWCVLKKDCHPSRSMDNPVEWRYKVSTKNSKKCFAWGKDENGKYVDDLVSGHPKKYCE